MAEFAGNLIAVDAQEFTTNGSGENADVLLSSSVLEIMPGSTNDFISGFRPADDKVGVLLFVKNVHATYNLLLKYTANSMSGFRMVMPSGTTTLTLAPGRGATLFYVKGEGWHPIIPGVLT